MAIKIEDVCVCESRAMESSHGTCVAGQLALKQLGLYLELRSCVRVKLVALY